MAGNNLDAGGPCSEVFGGDAANGGVGLAVDRAGGGSDHEAASPCAANLVPLRPRNNPNLKVFLAAGHSVITPGQSNGNAAGRMFGVSH
jgi:hypothetical protein